MRGAKKTAGFAGWLCSAKNRPLVILSEANDLDSSAVSEILRFAQNDGRFAQNDRRFAWNDMTGLRHAGGR
jgi:hypothetical protein